MPHGSLCVWVCAEESGGLNIAAPRQKLLVSVAFFVYASIPGRLASLSPGGAVAAAHARCHPCRLTLCTNNPSCSVLLLRVFVFLGQGTGRGAEDRAAGAGSGIP
jgi:hypothetical protein